MRKLKLILVSLAIVVGGVSEAWATDYTSSLPAYGQNWDLNSSGPCVGAANMTNTAPIGQCAEKSDYKFAEVYYNQNTGTQFEIYKTISVPNGTYIFQMAAFGRRANIWDADNPNTAVGINGEIFANDATTAVTTNAFVYYTVTTKVTNGSLKVGLRAKEGNLPNWWGYADYSLIKVDKESNVDLTRLLVNPSFETNSTEGWTLGGTSSDTKVCTPDGNHSTIGADGSYIFNTWWQGVPITQTIANLPNGHYSLKVALASSNDDADAKLFLFSQGDHSDVITITQGTQGTFNDYTYEFNVDNNSVTVGVVGGNADGTYNAAGHWWYKADNFRLSFTSVYVEDYSVALPANGVVEAGTWYYFTAGESDKRISGSSLGDIIITTNGNELISGGTSLNSYTGKLVPGTKYYIKSASAQTVTIESNGSPLAEDIYFFKVAAAHNGTNEVAAGPAGKYLARGRAYGSQATLMHTAYL